jgi:hypothetical protein
MKWTLRPAALVFALLLAVPAWAGDIEDCATADVAACHRLADQGDAMAQYNLGVMYAKGEGVPQDYAEAVKWYRKAADHGWADAQYNLGVMYYNGRGVPQDYAEAVKWFRKAADQGYANAQYNLGVMYDNGRGVPQDFVEAHKWFNLAATQGDADATKNRDVAASKMTPADISKAQKLAREWLAAHPQ